MREIPLSRGAVALVDDQDYEAVAHLRWHTDGVGYARHSSHAGGTRTTVYMHRLLIGAEPGQKVDHINGDTLDNRRANLRACSTAENARNRVKHVSTSSRFIGVHFNTAKRRWVARVRTDRRETHVGDFVSEIAAATARDDAARRLHGEFARLNFPREGERAALRSA